MVRFVQRVPCASDGWMDAAAAVVSLRLRRMREDERGEKGGKKIKKKRAVYKDPLGAEE